jgi:hypothetical protein
MLRRTLLLGLLSALSTEALSQNAPKLFILPKGVASPQITLGFNVRKRDFSLEGWLVANGALVSRLTYSELFEALGPNARVGDGVTTFGLPNFPVAYRWGEPFRGFAICPFSRLGLIAALAPFFIDSDI